MSENDSLLESERLATLRQYGVLDTPPEKDFDDLVALIAHICDTPIALISLVDRDRLWFKAKFGITATETPRRQTFCDHAIAAQDLFVVPDTACDGRYVSYPVVSGPQKIRFYAGAQLISPEGHALGNLCVLDVRPRRLSEQQSQALAVLGRHVMTQLELRRKTLEAARVNQALLGILEDTRAAEAALRASEELTHDVLDSMQSHIAVLSADGRIVAVNEAWRRFAQDNPDARRELLPRAEVGANYLQRALDVRPGLEHQASIARDGLHEVLDRRRKRFTFEYAMQSQGTTRWFILSAAPLRSGQGAVISQLEITERKQAEEQTRLSNERLQLVARATNDALWDWDVRFDLAWGNATFCEMLGHPPSVISAAEQTWIERVHPDDRERVGDSMRAAMAGDAEYWSDEYRIVTRKGEVLDVLDRAIIVRNGAGAPVRVIGAMMDITARKQAEIRINHLNRVYTVLSEINQNIVREKDRQAMLEASCRISVDKGGFGLAWIGMRESSPGQPIRIAAFATNGPMTRQALDAIANAPPGQRCAFTNLALAEGRHGICYDIATDPLSAGWREHALELGYRSMASFPLREGDTVVGVFNLYATETDFFDDEEVRLLDELATDISFALTVDAKERQRRRMELDLRTSEERFREVVENIHEVFWVFNPAGGELLYVSPAFATVWGIPLETLRANPKAWLQAVHPDDQPRIRSALAVKQTRGDYDEVYRIRRPDGTERWIRDRAFPVRDAAGVVQRVVGTAEDITAQRQLEQELRQSQKMEAIGLLAGGVAHDFNNILAAIMMQAEIAGAIEAVPQEAGALLEEIKTAASRAASLTRQLLAFGRRQVMQPRNIDLNEVVDNLSSMLQRLLGEGVRLKIDLDPAPLITFADAGMLGQLLMNLVINSRDAMPSGGELHIQTSSRQLGRTESRLIPDTVPGEYVSLRVTDTGVGIPPDIQSRIFEPFFSTKEPGKGTGLGLATVFGIVKQHGGAIRVQSEVGRGTTFEVLLRTAEPADDAANAEPASKAGEARRGTETVLVVEDEQSVRLLTRMVLERQGYRVLEAANGREALEVWQRHVGRIDLLFTDIVMPEGMSGRDLADRLRERRPDLKVIFTSGYSADIAGREFSLEPGQNFLQKPTRPQAIVEAVRRCLDG